jgi:UDP-N-acetylglucosamine 2-epimerase (non-hydrolysing)
MTLSPSILVVYATRPCEIKLFPFTKYEGFEFLEVNQSKDLHQGLINPTYKIEENELENFIKTSDYSAVMVQGDTRTAFRASLYAFEAKIPVIHIEAGMRTWDLTQPFPEEAYRQMIDIVAKYKYCSTLEATENCDGVYVGQTSIDTLVEFMPKCIEENFYIVTVHRTEAKIKQIINTLKKMNQEELVIFAHPNKVGQELKKHFKTHEPLPYKEFVSLLGRSKGCISDSGGLQEECIFLGKDFVSLREKSERGKGEVYEKGTTKKIVKDLNNEFGNSIKLARIRSI